MAGHAIICGGSIGGLFAAVAMLRAGWTVHVYERSKAELAGRGAGIVTHPQLIDALRAVGADLRDLGVETTERAAFDRAGKVVATLPFHQIVTSWDRLYNLLRPILPPDVYTLDKRVMRYRTAAESAQVTFQDGTTAEADVIVGADGFRSAIRAQMLPQIVPAYSGYVVWRALVDEAQLTDDLRRDVFGRFGLYLPTGLQIIGYPIAGPNNDLRAGHRRYNFVWYTPVAPALLQDMLTDVSGVCHSMTIPPPLIRPDVLAAADTAARDVLPQPFAQILSMSDQPFFTPIYDHHSPAMAEGRVALAGDAACVARPHVGMGVTKAAQDALTLAECLNMAPPAQALQAYSALRVGQARAAFDRARQLGAWMLAAPEHGHNADGRSNPNRAEIMRLTAIADF